jgi:hypothetical protein
MAALQSKRGGLDYGFRKNDFANKSKNNIDTLSRIQVKTTFSVLKPREFREPAKKNLLNRLGRFNEKNHPTPSNEKEIRFKICLF